MSLYQASIATSLCDNLVPTMVGPHKAILVQPPPAPPIPVSANPHVESPALMYWALGAVFGKFTTTVKHRKLTFALDGHDVGWFIPHVCIPPNNALTPIVIAFSTRTTNFCAMKVLAEKKPIATAQILLVPQPMTVCHEPISLPTGFSIAGSMQSVKIGMTLADLVLGLVTIAMSIIIDVFLAGGGKNTEAPTTWNTIGNFRSGMKELFESRVGFNPMSFLRNMPAIFRRESWRMLGTGLHGAFEHGELGKNLLKKLILGEFSQQMNRVGLARSVIKGAKNIPTEIGRMIDGDEGAPSIKLGGSGNGVNLKLGFKRTPGRGGEDATLAFVVEGSALKGMKHDAGPDVPEVLREITSASREFGTPIGPGPRW